MEKDNNDWKKITPEIVEAYTCITDKFLCPISANVYGIEFVAFKIRDLDRKIVLFEIKH